MKTVLRIVIAVLLVGALCGQEAPQTQEQIQQQKVLANQSIISGVPEDFKTPLKTFEAYFRGITASDASEYSCLTSKAIMELLDLETLTAADLQRISEGQKALDKKDFLLVEFRYTADENRPVLVIGYRFNYLGESGDRIPKTERERITMLRTGNGWKIDQIETEPF